VGTKSVHWSFVMTIRPKKNYSDYLTL
jgi:hypothetical protein